MAKKIRQSITLRLVILLVLVVFALYAAFYTLEAYYLAGYVIRIDGALEWTGSWGRTLRFLPFPERPKGPIMWVLTGMHPTDAWIYTNLIENKMLIVLNILLWLCIAVYFYWAVWRSTFRLV